MIGSIFENAQEAQSGMWPVLMLIMIPFFIAISLVQNPANPIAVIASMFPFASYNCYACKNDNCRSTNLAICSINCY